MPRWSALPDLPDLSALPPIAEQRGGDPTVLGEELFEVIRWGIDGHPRSAQTRIGPSEMGCPCARRLAYKLAGVQPVNSRQGAWRPTVGTAVHAWLEKTFVASNRKLGETRWLLEHRVEVGQIGEQTIDGSCDLYDRITATVVDWKACGPDALKRYKANGPGDQYRTQAHLYGYGWTRRGMPVDTVAICFLPSNGELGDAHFWHEPYQEAVALEALARVGAIADLVAAVGVAAVTVLPTADAYCGYCDWYLPAATNLLEACPGHR